MNIYFSGIGGVGIGPLAEIALDAGHTVQGSDPNESSIVTKLRDRGIVIASSQDGHFLENAHESNRLDLMVYTAALSRDHPELVMARTLGIPCVKRDELLAYIIEEKELKLIAVAGTHGKTTTTGMLVWTLQQLGIPVSYSIGTTINFGSSGKFDPVSKYFIYECDEYDRNFLHFSPALSLITSLDYDHPDTYPTKESYIEAFRKFVDKSEHTIMWYEDGLKINATIEDGWILGDNDILDVNLAGAHNRRNASLVRKAVEYLNLGDYDNTKAALNCFPGTDRRFEKLADNLYSDYGHHPVEIAATLQLAREINEHVVLIYQPHQNIRQHEIKDSYTHCFEGAEAVYWVPTYLSRENPALSILTPEELSQNVTNKEIIHTAELGSSLWHTISTARKEGKLVLCMGAGSIDKWVRDWLSTLN
jgi:UDP-N-acetylmuramate--alanine ligase